MEITLVLFVTLIFFSKIKSFTADKDKVQNENEHALFYRTEKMPLKNREKVKNFLSHVDLLEEIIVNTTDPSTTTLVYEYNDTTMEAENMSTASNYQNISDITESPEITLFSKPSVPVNTEKPVKKGTSETKTEKYCECDLTFGGCDVNCCCDEDCSDEHKTLFDHCYEPPPLRDNRYCHPNIFAYKNNTPSKLHFDADNLFCILKENLPDKRIIPSYKKPFQEDSEKILNFFYKWSPEASTVTEQRFKSKFYTFGDTLWALDNSTVMALDFPSSHGNNYCHGRTVFNFLKNTRNKCMVKIDNLEMFEIYKHSERKLIAGVPQLMKDADVFDVKNCSQVRCVNLTIQACNFDVCEPFNQSIHSASCDEFTCTNIATNVEYEFHSNGTMINRATIYLHFSNITVSAFVQQEINVKYYLNKENGTAVELSGNPGYIVGKPLIKKDHPENTCNVSNHITSSKISAPKNEGGVCVLSNLTREDILFGVNTRSNCKYSFAKTKLESNATKACNILQQELYTFLQLCEDNKISPLGNPKFAKDWVSVVHDKYNGKQLYGAYKHNETLTCYNFVSHLGYEFTFANERRIESARIQSEFVILNGFIRYKESPVIHFDLQAPSVIISITVQFFDFTKPMVIEYARGPQLFIHLPSDFFYPFTSNECNKVVMHISVLLMCVLIVMKQINI